MLWLIGHKGMLGTEVASRLTSSTIDFVATDLDLDITSPDAVRAFVFEHRPDWIINCAAYTAVDQAEDDEERAHAINALGPENIARAAAELTATAHGPTKDLAAATGSTRSTATDPPGAPPPNPPASPAPRLIHISTDYVFPGTATEPIPESAAPAPVGAYGRTKAAGEARLRAAHPNHFIVRTAWLYGPAGKNFVATMLRLMGERDELSVVADQRGTPTYAADLAAALVAFVLRDSRGYGTYHYTNSGETTWHGFAEAIRDEALARGMLGSSPRIRAVTSAEYPTKAARPSYSVLSRSRIEAELETTIPDWRDGLARYLDRVKTEKTEGRED